MSSTVSQKNLRTYKCEVIMECYTSAVNQQKIMHYHIISKSSTVKSDTKEAAIFGKHKHKIIYKLKLVIILTMQSSSPQQISNNITNGSKTGHKSDCFGNLSYKQLKIISASPNLLNKGDSRNSWNCLRMTDYSVIAQCIIHLTHITPYAFCKSQLCHPHI